MTSIAETDTVAPRAHPSSPLGTFVRDVSFTDLPSGVLHQARRCVLDLVGTAAAGALTPLSAIIRKHAVEQFGAGAAGAQLIFDGRRASPAGAALAGGMTIDSFDAHDGHALTKGHAGAAVLPGLLAIMDGVDEPMTGREFLTSLVVGYEVAIRAGIVTHRISPDYHTSGSWNALGVAALAARRLRLGAEALRHALGIAEFHGPRSQMMRCIDHPTMLKDGSGVGAMVGTSAAYLARDGFTGAPALVVEIAEAADIWADLGTRWRILEMYFKPYPVCRWAHPAIRAVLDLRNTHAIDPDAVESIEIHTFHEAVRLAHPAPANTEEAQYSLSFPVAAAMRRGRLGPADIVGGALRDPATIALARRVRLVDDAALSALFPAKRLARAVVRLQDGSVFTAQPMPAHGDAEDPFPDDEIKEKFLAATLPSIRPERAAAIIAATDRLDAEDGPARLAELVVSPPDAAERE